MPTGESLLVLVDYFSRWVEVDVIKSTNPVSAEMEEYLDEMGIKHRLTAPLLPRANGEVER